MDVSAQVVISDKDYAMLMALDPARLAAFLKRQGDNAVAQVQRNFIQQGGIGGDGKWPPLSPGYAKEKAKGNTPGHGRFKYAMLRDTGQLYASLRSKVTVSADESSVQVTAEGDRVVPKGAAPLTNDALLAFHVKGDGVPKRSPLDGMRQFEDRFARELDKFLDGLDRETAGKAGG